MQMQRILILYPYSKNTLEDECYRIIKQKLVLFKSIFMQIGQMAQNISRDTLFINWMLTQSAAKRNIPLTLMKNTVSYVTVELVRPQTLPTQPEWLSTFPVSKSFLFSAGQGRAMHLIDRKGWSQFLQHQRVWPEMEFIKVQFPGSS